MKYSDIPNEILTNVFKHLSDQNLYQCLFVCKLWLTPVQMALYKQLTVNIGFTDNVYETLIFDTLVNSIYMPGRWVKKITVKHLKVPDNMFDHNPSRDPLHLLITYCPHVEDFCFARTNFIFQAEWMYLQAVLEKRRDDWSLYNFATYFDEQDYDCYYNCALIMKDSLKIFYLKQKQLDYGMHFKEFTRIHKLFISRRVIADIVEIDSIISNVPHLTCIDTEFYIPKPQESRNVKQKKVEYCPQTFPDLKELHLKNFPLSRDQELFFIMEKFINLDSIKIAVAKGKPWPISKISPDILTSFFQFICKSRDYSVAFTDIDIVRALHLYFISQDQNDGNFHISFTNIFDKGENATCFQISSDEYVKVIYNLVGNSSTGRTVKAKQLLTSNQNFIYNLQVSLLGKHTIAKKIEDFLPLVLESCKKLKKLTVIGGHLTSTINKKSKKQPRITELIFKKACIDLTKLPDIMTLFPYLHLFELDNCQFQGDDAIDHVTDIHLNMFETGFDTIKVSFQDTGMPGVPKSKTDEFGIPVIPIKKNKVFIIINLVDAQKTKYYCGDIFVGDMMTVTRASYYEHLKEAQKTENYQLNYFVFNVKSLKNLQIITPVKYLLCKINKK